LATDPLLCHLTPVTINRLSTSGDFDFEPGEKEWSLRAAEGTIKVNEWLREVEGWNREWRRTYRESKDAGDGYLPPADRPEKRRKIGMGSIREEEEGAMLDGSKPVRRRLFSEDNGTGGSGGVIVKDDTPEVGAVESPKPQTDSPSLRRGGKPLTPYQLKMQRQRAAEVENGPTPVDGRLEPDQILVKPVEKIGAKEGREEEEEEEEEEEDDQDDELEEGVEYWGSLKRSVVEGYEARIEVIKSEIEELDVDGLKDRVLCESGPSLPPSLTHRMLTAGLISVSCQRSRSIDRLFCYNGCYNPSTAPTALTSDKVAFNLGCSYRRPSHCARFPTLVTDRQGRSRGRLYRHHSPFHQPRV